MMNRTAATAISKSTVCPSLEDSGLSLSSTSVTAGSVVHLECSRFGHRPTDGVRTIVCHITGDWLPPVPSCEWSWDFSPRERIIFGTLVAAASFFILVSFVVFVAYVCCYRKRRTINEKLGYIPRPMVTEGYSQNGRRI